MELLLREEKVGASGAQFIPTDKPAGSPWQGRQKGIVSSPMNVTQKSSKTSTVQQDAAGTGYMALPTLALSIGFAGEDCATMTPAGKKKKRCASIFTDCTRTPQTASV
jgi:hypothetical protein